MIVDLRTEKPGGTWVRRFGDHEDAGFEVSLSDRSVHITIIEHGIMFAVDRQDIPAAWEPTIDIIKLRGELIATIVRHMSVAVLEALLGEIRTQRQRAFWDGERSGERSVRTTIREALGL